MSVFFIRSSNFFLWHDDGVTKMPRSRFVIIGFGAQLLSPKHLLPEGRDRIRRNYDSSILFEKLQKLVGFFEKWSEELE